MYGEWLLKEVGWERDGWDMVAADTRCQPYPRVGFLFSMFSSSNALGDLEEHNMAEGGTIVGSRHLVDGRMTARSNMTRWRHQKVDTPTTLRRFFRVKEAGTGPYGLYGNLVLFKLRSPQNLVHPADQQTGLGVIDASGY